MHPENFPLKEIAFKEFKLTHTNAERSNSGA